MQEIITLMSTCGCKTTYMTRKNKKKHDINKQSPGKKASELETDPVMKKYWENLGQ